MTNQFIKQQQELGRKCTCGVEDDCSDLLYTIKSEDLDTLITQIITNTEEELLRRAEGEIMCDEDCPCDYRWAINDIKQHITNLTEVE